MRSIRLSLIIYFLLLLAVALGAVSLLAYRTTALTLQEKQEANRQLLRQQYEHRRQEEMEALDRELLVRARSLALLAQSKFEASRLLPLRFVELGVLTAAMAPSGHLLVPLWVAESDHPPLAMQIANATATNIQLNEDLLHRDGERANDFLQINGLRGRAWRSRSMVQSGDTLPFDPGRFRKMRMLEWDFDLIEINGQSHRRVMFKAPIMQWRYSPPSMPFPRPEGSRGSRRTASSSSSGPGPSGFNSEPPGFYIQVAASTLERDRTLTLMEAEIREQVQQADEQARNILTRLQIRLATVALLTFGGIFVGSSILIGIGLSPLRRLSEAVSRVTEQDVYLRLDGPSPPRELVPIITRLTKTLEMLREAFDREKQATADISHELRTPLAGLLTTLDVVLKKPRSAPEYQESLIECRDIARQMTQMVERLLMLSRLDAKSDRIRRDEFDAAVITEECAKLVRPMAKAKGLSLNVHSNGDARIVSDPDKLREIISNLMHNAVEYNRPSGRIEVAVTPCDGGVSLEVSDTGIGIAPEDLSKIFERFFRADAARHESTVHSGLGLSIVRGYVGLLGGSITVESRVGEGTTFRIKIPSTGSVENRLSA